MRRPMLCAWAAAGIAAAGCAAAPAAAERPPIGFEALCAFDALPRLADWPACQDSSYHRDDINADAGNFLRVEPNGDQVLVDTDGPGIVYRVWSTGVVGMQMSKECRLRFHFDGEEPAAQEPLPACAERLPKTALPAAPAFMCCELEGAPALGGAPLEKREFSALNPRFDSRDGLWRGRGRAGDALVAKLALPGEDDFAVQVFTAGGPTFAALDAALDGAPLGRIDARRPGLTPWFMTEFGPLRLAGGMHELRLAIAEGSGEERDAGLVAVQLKPRSPFLQAWWVIGNWPCPQDGGWAIVNEVERTQDVRAAYKLADGSETRWRAFDGPHVDLGGAGWAAAYGLTYVWSPDERSVGCCIAKDDGMRIWLNDRVVFDRNTWSHAWHDQFSCTMSLAKGWNKVLVKCANWSGSWGFALRLGDPDGVLRCAREPIEQQ